MYFVYFFFDIFVFILFNSFHLNSFFFQYIYIFIFCIFYIYLYILLFYNFQISVNSLMRSSFHNFKFALQCFIVLSAVLVDSSPLKTVSMPSLSLTSLAAFRYSHRTRPNSGPDQITLVLKLKIEPFRSWCCLHIHAKFWSAAAVGILGPISVSQHLSQQCLQTVCVVKT